jgi:hypothetical protein
MQNAAHSSLPRFGKHRGCVIFGVARMNYHRQIALACERQLCGERTPLLQPRRIVVVVVEAALANSNGASAGTSAYRRDIISLIETRRIMRMHSGREPYEPGVLERDTLGRASGAEDIPGAAPRADADDCSGTTRFRALNYVDAVAVERRVCEVRVAVDEPEPFETPIFLGHFLSIHRSVGPAM